MGIRPAELGAMAPRELHDLMDAWEARERRLDFRAGQICTVVAEPNRDRKTMPLPFHPADFFSSLEDARPDVPSDEEMERKLEAFGDTFSKG